MDALKLEHVEKHYPDFSIRDLNLTLPAGCILGLAGENGAGKSTTLRMIMDAIGRDGGTITVLGVDNQSPEFLHTKEDIGVVLDEAYFPPGMHAGQIGKMMGMTYRNWDDALYRRYLQQFKLPEKKQYKDYSRGMRMKLAIAVALSHAPKLLLLDEATSGLDPVVRDDILDIFFAFTRDENHTILISSHILSDLEKVCDYIAFLHEGRLLLYEEKDRLLDSYGIAAGSQDLADLPEEAIAGIQRSQYGVRALVKREKANPAIPLQKPTIEDIMLFLVKGEMKL